MFPEKVSLTAKTCIVFDNAILYMSKKLMKVKKKKSNNNKSCKVKNLIFLLLKTYIKNEKKILHEMETSSSLLSSAILSVQTLHKFRCRK